MDEDWLTCSSVTRQPSDCLCEMLNLAHSPAVQGQENVLNAQLLCRSEFRLLILIQFIRRCHTNNMPDAVLFQGRPDQKAGNLPAAEDCSWGNHTPAFDD